MVRALFFTFFMILFIVVACSNQSDKGFYHKSGNMIYSEEQSEMFNKGSDEGGYGFVRQVKNPVPQAENEQNIPPINREHVAESISQLIVRLPNVNDASVVVTDQEVLIAYTIENDGDRLLIRDQVAQAARTGLPGWFDVYVTDVDYIRQDIENIASIDPNTPDRRTKINYVIDLINTENEKTLK